MKWRRFGAMMLAGALAAGCLTGCSGGKDTSVTEGKETVRADTKASGSKEKVTLRFSWWGDEGRHEGGAYAVLHHEQGGDTLGSGFRVGVNGHQA